MIVVNLNDKEVELVKGKYMKDRLAIEIINSKSKEPLADLTVNIPPAIFYNEDAFVTEVKSDLNNYSGVKFKTEPLNKMEFA